MKLIACSSTTLYLLSFTVYVRGSFPFRIMERLHSRQPERPLMGVNLERMTAEAFLCVFMMLFNGFERPASC